MENKQENSAGGIVYLKQGDKVLWLVTKHSQFGHWSFPKGLIGDTKKEETIEAAALREVEEEGGIKAEIIAKLPEPIQYTYRWEKTLIKKTVYYFLMRYLSGNPEDHDWEVSEAKFLPAEEVEKILTFKKDKKAFHQALEMTKL